MSKRSRAVSNDAVAEEAAENLLLSGGSAMAAVIAGYFAAAGAHSGVLLSPLSVLIGGAGVGDGRAFDGRLRQPGLGAKRPRGFKKGETVPDAARVAVASSVAALFVAHAYDGGGSLSSILKAGIRLAERAGADSRADLLKRIRGVGAGALTEPAFVRPLLQAAGPSEGGLLTPADFAAIPSVDGRAVERRVGDRTVIEAPWAAEGADAPGDGVGCAVLAIDGRGVCAGVLYRRVLDGLPIEALELEAPLSAVPVERGVARRSPGERLATPTPLALIKDAGAYSIVAAPGRPTLDEEAIAAPQIALMAKRGEIEVVRAR